MLSRSSSLLRVTASRLTAARLVRSSARAMSTNAPKTGPWARYNELLLDTLFVEICTRARISMIAQHVRSPLELHPL
jgi:hypothetical protein